MCLSLIKVAPQRWRVLDVNNAAIQGQSPSSAGTPPTILVLRASRRPQSTELGALGGLAVVLEVVELLAAPLDGADCLTEINCRIMSSFWSGQQTPM